ncbi:MAG: DUF4230 domain-containing protein [Clostridia bacterium]|nr:DUF4230 domain-containing protein [Clostridia bacterium]MBQ6646634.1 DUF4230 domain-containing protein [Clostridia bacterium]
MPRATKGKKKAGTKTNWEVLSLLALLAFGVVLLVILVHNIYVGKHPTKMTKQQSSSNLISTREIATLSVSEFVYNGIAQSLKENGKVDYSVLYKSTIKVGIDANSIHYVVDEKNKSVTFILPEFTIENPVIDIGSLKFLPSRDNLLMNEVVALCRSDALNELQQSTNFITSARENLKSIVEAWYSPALNGYSFEYRFNTQEGGFEE